MNYIFGLINALLIPAGQVNRLIFNFGISGVWLLVYLVFSKYSHIEFLLHGSVILAIISSLCLIIKRYSDLSSFGLRMSAHSILFGLMFFEGNNSTESIRYQDDYKYIANSVIVFTISILILIII